MKNKLLTLTLLALSLVPIEIALAKCFPGDPAEYNTTCPSKPKSELEIFKKLVFGKNFCEVGSNGSTGISIDKAGIVGFFAANSGAPNPHTYFAVIRNFTDNPIPFWDFKIQEYEKLTNRPTGEAHQYYFNHLKKVIYFDQSVFTQEACL